MTHLPLVLDAALTPRQDVAVTERRQQHLEREPTPLEQAQERAPLDPPEDDRGWSEPAGNPYAVFLEEALRVALPWSRRWCSRDDDAWGEASLRLHQNLRRSYTSFRTAPSIEGYVRQSAKNAVMDVWRSQHTGAALPVDLSALEPVPDGTSRSTQRRPRTATQRGVEQEAPVVVRTADGRHFAQRGDVRIEITAEQARELRDQLPLLAPPPVPSTEGLVLATVETTAGGDSGEQLALLDAFLEALAQELLDGAVSCPRHHDCATGPVRPHQVLAAVREGAEREVEAQEARDDTRAPVTALEAALREQVEREQEQVGAAPGRTRERFAKRAVEPCLDWWCYRATHPLHPLDGDALERAAAATGERPAPWPEPLRATNEVVSALGLPRQRVLHHLKTTPAGGWRAEEYKLSLVVQHFTRHRDLSTVVRLRLPRAAACLVRAGLR